MKRVVSPLFKKEIIVLRKEVYQKRAIQAFIIATATSLSLSASFGSKQPLNWKMMEMVMSSGMWLASAFVSKSREELESRHQTFVNFNNENLKADIKNTFVHDSSMQELDRDMSYVGALQDVPVPISAQVEYLERVGIPTGWLQNLLPQPTPDVKAEVTTSELKQLGVKKPDQNTIDGYVNPTSASLIKQLAEAHPSLVRIDKKWILELIQNASEQDMKKRSNHHFFISAETQAGKSTLAGVIARGIAQRSCAPATIAIHDAKKIAGMNDITRWLCGYTYKIDGYEGTSKWLKLVTKLGKDQFIAASETGGSCKGVAESIFIQDEATTIYGQGKGYTNVIPPDLAVDLNGQWIYQINNLAGCKGHSIIIGQSPLSGDTGIKKPIMNGVCLIALGQTSGYVLKSRNINEFVNHYTEEQLKIWQGACDLFEREQLRYAFVRPMRGTPYVAVIPEFDVDAILNGEDVIETLQDGYQSKKPTEVVDEVDDMDGMVSDPDSIGTSDAWEQEYNSKPEVAQPEAEPVSKPGIDYFSLISKMGKWIELCEEKFQTKPSPEHIKQAWYEETGIWLDGDTLKLVLDKLGVNQ